MSYTGRAGIQAEIGNFAIGLNYGIQCARHETNHSLNAGFTWKF
ncbi:MAG: autotransporter outer membrane beta-barrel domain-containing protein [Desulfovibrionaceae bacterium]|nr:autotransporter outer membrane beta-barrel domain-containing protein [Desulfovibrionaceae bacterium]